MGVAVINGKIYAAGGLSGSTHVNRLTVYDPAVNSWTTLAPMSVARDHLTAAALEGTLYATGGRFTDIVPATGATEIYNPATNSWSTAASMLTAIHVMLQKGVDYRDLGADHLERAHKHHLADRLTKNFSNSASTLL